MPSLNAQLVYPEAEPAYVEYCPDRISGNAVLWSLAAAGCAVPWQTGDFPRAALRVAR